MNRLQTFLVLHALGIVCELPILPSYFLLPGKAPAHAAKRDAATWTRHGLSPSFPGNPFSVVVGRHRSAPSEVVGSL